MKSYYKIIFILMVSVTIFACQSYSKKIPSTTIEQSLGKTSAKSYCKNPRPEICTKEYRPVCAELDIGIRCVKAPCPSKQNKTYSNACTACSDDKVFAYQLNACK